MAATFEIRDATVIIIKVWGGRRQQRQQQQQQQQASKQSRKEDENWKILCVPFRESQDSLKYHLTIAQKREESE